MRKILGMVGFCSVLGLTLPSNVQATTLVLEGSDASTFHGGQAGGDTYTQQLIAFLREGSSLPVAVFSQTGSTLPTAPAGSVVYLSDLTGLSVDDYSALYIMSPFGCCSQNLSGAQTYASEIGAFYDSGNGGSVAIQDYTGGDWSFIDSVLAAPPADSVRGYDTGYGGPGCTDAEVFNSEGLLKGFTQPPPLGCWEHQAYDNAYFVDVLGFLSLVDADPAYDAAGSYVWTQGGSAFLALGGALGDPGCTDPAGCEPGEPVPEPATFSLLALGAAGVARRWRVGAAARRG